MPPPTIGGRGIKFSGSRSVRPLTPIMRDVIIPASAGKANAGMVHFVSG